MRTQRESFYSAGLCSTNNPMSLSSYWDTFQRKKSQAVHGQGFVCSEVGHNCWEDLRVSDTFTGVPVHLRRGPITGCSSTRGITYMTATDKMNVIQPIRVVWGKLGQSPGTDWQVDDRLAGREDHCFHAGPFGHCRKLQRWKAQGAQNWESCLEHALCAWGYSSLEGLSLVVQLPS